jgi:hypothetical protein
MSKSLQIFADEGRIDGGGPFYFGGLICSPVRAKRLDEQIQNFRTSWGCDREMK